MVWKRIARRAMDAMKPLDVDQFSSIEPLSEV